MSWFDLNRWMPNGKWPALSDVQNSDPPGLRLAFQAATKKALGLSAPTREEFDAWRDDPVTQFVMAALRRNADECRDQWLRESWEGGNADQRTLDGLRERSDALLGFTADYTAFCETLGLEPQEEEQAA